MERFFSVLAGLLSAAFVLVLGIHAVLERMPTSEFGEVFGPLMAAGLIAVLAYSVTRLLALAYVVQLLRGSQAVAWAAPSHCDSFWGWAAHQWSFLGSGGVMQRGVRYFGLEIALEGSLS